MADYTLSYTGAEIDEAIAKAMAGGGGSGGSGGSGGDATELTQYSQGSVDASSQTTLYSGVIDSDLNYNLE